MDTAKPMPGKQRVLVIEDDPCMLSLVCQGLRDVGHSPMPASDGETAIELALKLPFDSIVLDLGLPRRDGYSVARAIRAHSNVRILMLTARDGEEDILRGFKHGADDYLTKPFSFRELVARLDALSRAVSRQAKPGLRVDASRLLVFRGDTPIALTRNEYLLLSRLQQHSGSPVGRQSLMEAVWEDPGAVSSNALEVLVNSLRAKLDGPFADKLLITVRGVGYCLQVFPGTDRRQAS